MNISSPSNWVASISSPLWITIFYLDFVRWTDLDHDYGNHNFFDSNAN